MAHTPYRTGIPTILKALTIICLMISTYRHVMEGILTEGQMVYVTALEQACNDFKLNVPNHRPYDP